MTKSCSELDKIYHKHLLKYLTRLKERVSELEEWEHQKKLWTTYLSHLTAKNKRLEYKIQILTKPNQTWFSRIYNLLICKSYNSIDIEPERDSITDQIIKQLKTDPVTPNPQLAKDNKTSNDPLETDPFYKKPLKWAHYLPKEFNPEFENLVTF